MIFNNSKIYNSINKPILVLINTNNRGGAENIAVSIHNYLTVNNFKCSLIAVEEGRSNNKLDENLNFLLNKKTTSNKLFKFFDIWLAAFSLKGIVYENKANVVQSHTYRANCINVLSILLGSNHKAQIVNHSTFSRYKKSFTGRLFLKIIEFLYTKADSIIVISNAMLLDLKANFNNKLFTKAEVIHNPYELQKIISKSFDSTVINNFSLLEKDYEYILTLGRIIELKRIKDLILAYYDLRLILISKKIKVFIVGDGESKSDLQLLVKELNLNEHLIFISALHNPFPLIKYAKFLVLASEIEGFPNVLIEAMACNCPVISADCISGPREILTDSNNDSLNILKYNDELELAKYGVLYPVKNIEMLKKAILLYLDDSDLLFNYKKSIKHRAYHFDVKEVMPKYINSLIQLN